MSDKEKEKDIKPEVQEELLDTPGHADEKQSGQVLPEPGKVRKERRDFMGKMLIGGGVALGLELGYSVFKLMATKPVGEKKPVEMSLSQLPENSRTTV